MSKSSPIVTMARIAEAAGVSKATVSRALGGSSLIGGPVVSHVKAVAEKMGYVRRNQRRHSERSILTIKLVLPPSTSRTANLFYSLFDLVDGLREGLSPSGTNIIVETAGKDYVPFPHKKGGEVDAFVFAFHRPPAAVFEEIKERGVKCLVLNRVVRGVRQVVSDHCDAMRQVAEHLFSKGVAGNCCFVGYRGIEDVMRMRVQGFTEGCAANGITFEAEEDVWIADSPEGIKCEKIKAEYERGVRVFVGVNDVVGSLLVQQLHELGYKIPHDILVTGCDNSPLCDVIIPRLTTVDLSIRTLAMRAGRNLHAGIVDGVESEQSILVRGELLIGETT